MSPQAPIKTIHIYIATALMIVTAVWTSYDVGEKVGQGTATMNQLVKGQAELVEGQKDLRKSIVAVAELAQFNKETNIEQDGKIRSLERERGIPRLSPEGSTVR